MDYYEMIMRTLVDYKVPLYVRKDILSRSFDWMLSGGSETDDYIKNQYEYLLRVVEDCQKNR